MAAVVSDTSPILALAHLGRLELLGAVFGRVVVPTAVEAELLSPPPGLPRVLVRDLELIEVRSPTDEERVRSLQEDLDPGEAEAIVLALEVGATVILIDERAGRAEAERFGLVPIGVLGLLVRAKQRGLVDAVGPLIDRLRAEIDFYVSESLPARVLRLAGEDDGGTGP